MRNQDTSEHRTPLWWVLLFLLVALPIGCSDQTDPLLRSARTTVPSDTSSEGDAQRSEDDGGATALATDAADQSATSAQTDDVADRPMDETDQAPPINQVADNDALLEGSASWAVVVAGASDPYDALLEDAVTELGAAGFSAEITNCDVGAAQALQMSPTGTFTVSVYYGSEAAASEGVAVLAAVGITGVATEIETNCPE